MRYPKKWISIDPGFNTGVAIWEKEKLIGSSLLVAPDNTNMDLPERIEYLLTLLTEIYDRNPPEAIIIEGVYLFGDALRSITSARRGDLFKLAYVVGAYMCLSFGYTSVIIIKEAREWKGQLPDAVVMKRIKKLYPKCSFSIHEADAIGIGLNYLGLF